MSWCDSWPDALRSPTLDVWQQHTVRNHLTACKVTVHCHNENDLFTSQIILQSNKSSNFLAHLNLVVNFVVNTQRLLFYHQSTARQARVLSHLTALPCNLIVPELHQFPEQSIPPWCPRPLHRLQYELHRPGPLNQRARRQLGWPEGPWLQTCVPSCFFVVSILTGGVSLRIFENQDVARMWWDPWGSDWTFEPPCRGQSGRHRQY